MWRCTSLSWTHCRMLTVIHVIVSTKFSKTVDFTFYMLTLEVYYPTKIEDIRLLAQNSRAACIGISETWLDKTVSDSEINIQNYNIIRRDGDRHGGGVCLFIHSELAFNTRSDLLHENLEAIWAEIPNPYSLASSIDLRNS
jgi:hypothetical protein